MQQKFCMERQNATACCGRKNPNEKCKIDLRKGQWDALTLNLDELPYGGSCTYEVKARCGFPKLTVNSTNIDMVVAYKRKDWGNDTYEPSDDDKYDDDETYNPKPNSKGQLEFWLKAREKKEDKNETDDKKCKETKLWLTLTNLLNPMRSQLDMAEVGRRGPGKLVQVSGIEELQVTTDPTVPMTVYGYSTSENIVTVSTTAADEGAPDNSALHVAFSFCITLMITLAFLF